MSTDEFNVPLAAALAEIQRRTFGAMKKFLTLVRFNFDAPMYKIFLYISSSGLNFFCYILGYGP